MPNFSREPEAWYIEMFRSIRAIFAEWLKLLNFKTSEKSKKIIYEHFDNKWF